jgi:hypothetical protein
MRYLKLGSEESLLQCSTRTGKIAIVYYSNCVIPYFCLIYNKTSLYELHVYKKLFLMEYFEHNNYLDYLPKTILSFKWFPALMDVG